MGFTSDYWKYFLVGTSSGLAYYVDSMGMMQTGNITDRTDYALPEDPIGWEDNQLAFGRNHDTDGINVSYTIPLKFVGDGAFILRKLFYGGRFIEAAVSLVVLKWNPETGVHELYYKGQIDLAQEQDDVAEGISVNVKSTGATELMRVSYDKVIQLPCDGSIPENVKVLDDGILFNDTFHYQILKLSSPYFGQQPLPCVYLSNDGTNVGIIKGDQNLDQTTSAYFQQSSNFIFSSVSPISVRIRGSISVKSDPAEHNTLFYIFIATSLTQPGPLSGSITHAQGLVKSQYNVSTDPSGIFLPVNSETPLDGQKSFFFDATVKLAANENLFLMYFNHFSAFPTQILGGSFTLSFSSRNKPARIWGIPAPDVWTLLGKAANTLASTPLQTFNYKFTSNFLAERRRWVLTSGDAARAASNPNYYQFFNQSTQNPSNPNNQYYNQFPSTGPVAKVSPSDFFKSVNAIGCAAVGNQLDEDGRDSIFLEAKKKVYNSDVVTMVLASVNKFKTSVDLDKIYSWLKIGYAPNSYDEISGKFEYNNTSQFQTEIKSLTKTLEIISPIRTDSYGFELTRSNNQGGKSTTFNSSDNSLWFLNVDFTSFIYDYYKAEFISTIVNPAAVSGTNITLTKIMSYQPVPMQLTDGEYFVDSLDFCIFMLNQAVSVSRTIHVEFDISLNGLTGDSATVKMYINGAVFQSWSQNVTSVDTAFSATFDSSRVFTQGDNIYFTIDTIKTCTAQINSFQLNVDSGYFICQSTGPTTIPASSVQQLIALPLIDATLVAGLEVVSYGFQFLRFLSNVTNRNFDWSFIVSGFVQGSPSEAVTIELWKNGVRVDIRTFNGTTVQSQFNPSNDVIFSGNTTLNNYDIYWITASCGNLTASISYAAITFTSTFVKAYKLLREQYDIVSGVPHPETAFNIKDFTPGRMARANGGILKPALLNLAPTALMFQSTDKNSFLSTTKDGVTITERADIDSGELEEALYYTILFEIETEVPYTFEQIMMYAANGHIQFPYKNKTFYGFPLQVSVKPTMNDTQTWKLLASTKNNISDLIDLDYDGVITLNLMDILIPYVCPVHCVPLAYMKDARFNSFTMDEDWFVNRVKDYIDKNNYYAPWQINDIMSLQCRTGGLSPVTVQILNDKGQPIGAPINIPSITAGAVLPPNYLYQKDIAVTNFSSLAGEGKYYFLWSMGVGEGTGVFISEGLDVKAFHPKTQLTQYWHKRNKIGVIFNSSQPYRPSIRMHSQLNKYQPKSKFTTYVNEPQDISLLNAIPYDTWNLQWGFSSGIPDYMMRKMDRIFGLSDVYVDGNQYSREADAEVEVKYTDGQMKGYLNLAIRKAKNGDGFVFNTESQLSSDMPGGYTLDARAFGQTNGDQYLIQVES